MPANQSLSGPWLGYVPVQSAPSMTASTLNSATAWLGLSFVPTESKTVSELSVFLATKPAAYAATDLSADVYSDSSGAPASAGSLGSTTTVTAATSNGIWLRFTGLSVAVTAGQLYWAVFKNPNTASAAPATNFPIYQFGATNSAPAIWGMPGTGVYGWARKNTTTGDGGWGTASACVAGLRVGFSDGSYLGLPISIVGNTPSGSRAFGSAEFGVKLVTPANATLAVRGAMLGVAPSGTPANLEFKLYTGTGPSPTLQATSYAIPRASISTAQHLPAAFPSAVSVAGGTTVRITVHQVAGGGDASNTILSPADMTWDPDANSTALMPLGAQRTYWSGSAWDDASNAAASSIMPFALILDSTGPFASAGGSSQAAVIVRRGGTLMKM